MISWQQVLVLPTDPIRLVMEIIDEGSLQIALVVNDFHVLKGTVTDGDIRRAILRGVSLEEPVHSIMNSKPLVVKPETCRNDTRQLMREKSLHHIPVVDGEGKVVGLEVMEDIINTNGNLKNPVLLMVGGLGTRLRPLTNDIPKPLLHVGDKPVLETIIERLASHRFKNIYMAVNYRSDQLRSYFGDGSKWDVEIKYLQENEKLGTAGALGMLPDDIKLPVIVMNGDLLTKVNFHSLLNFHQSSQADATMGVREFHLQIPYGIVQIFEHTVVDIVEKPSQTFFINAGIYVLNPATFHLTPPSDQPIDMPQLFRLLKKENYETVAFPIREYWIDIGKMEDFKRANEEYHDVFAPVEKFYSKRPITLN